MEKENTQDARCGIERGRVTAAEADGYMVASFDRRGVAAKLKSLDGKTYSAGDRVFYFLFDDGTGRILGLMD